MDLMYPFKNTPLKITPICLIDSLSSIIMHPNWEIHEKRDYALIQKKWNMDQNLLNNLANILFQDIFTVYLGQNPQGTSAKTLSHLAQLANTGNLLFYSCN